MTTSVMYHCPVCEFTASGEIASGTDWGDPEAIALCPNDGTRLSELRLTANCAGCLDRQRRPSAPPGRPPRACPVMRQCN